MTENISRNRGKAVSSESINPVPNNWIVWLPPGPKLVAVKVPETFWFIDGENVTATRQLPWGGIVTLHEFV